MISTGVPAGATDTPTGAAEFGLSAILLLEIIAVLLVFLVVLYALLTYLRGRHTKKRYGISRSRCAICKHHVKFISSCCREPVKYMGPTGICTKCRKVCDVVCHGCSHDECLDNCERCVRKVEPGDVPAPVTKPESADK